MRESGTKPGRSLRFPRKSVFFLTSTDGAIEVDAVKAPVEAIEVPEKKVEAKVETPEKKAPVKKTTAKKPVAKKK